MILPVEDILGGTWGGAEAPPDEWQDFVAMKEMHLTWREWVDTPEYVKRYIRDYLGMVNRRANAD